MKETMLTEFAPREATVRRYLEEYRPWIRSTLGCPIADAVLLELDFPVVQAAAAHLLSGVRLRHEDARTLRELEKLVESVELPGYRFATLEVRWGRESQGRLMHRPKALEAEWRGGPAALWLRGLSEPVVAMSIPILTAGRAVEERCDCVLLRRTSAPSFLNLLERIRRRRDGSYLHVFGSGRQRVGRLGWEDLVLCESVVQLVRKDFETFLERESWFRARRLPFRRGYLFHGPPGNGKTSVIRAMLQQGKLDGHAVALFCEKTDDYYLERMFQLAASNAPSLIVLEDIDRAFPRSPSAVAQTKVSLPQLLNCLDGLGTQEGVVVVATANDPTALDAAILRRPGRFDRVVEFPMPDGPLRTAYLSKFLAHLAEQEVADCAQESEGFSFAQLREVYILASQCAYATSGKVTQREVRAAIDSLRRGMAGVSEQKNEVGFSASFGTDSGHTLLNCREPGGEG